jgi:hypothetical protein
MIIDGKTILTMRQVAEFTAEQLRAANIRGARVETSDTKAGPAGPSMTTLSVQRVFGIDGSIYMIWDVARDHEDDSQVKFRPRVCVNFPAVNKDALQGVAFLHLVQELAMLAASIQVQLDAIGPVVADKKAA